MSAGLMFHEAHSLIKTITDWKTSAGGGRWIGVGAREEDGLFAEVNAYERGGSIKVSIGEVVVAEFSDRDNLDFLDLVEWAEQEAELRRKERVAAAVAKARQIISSSTAKT